jgi:hypothetical protein
MVGMNTFVAELKKQHSEFMANKFANQQKQKNAEFMLKQNRLAGLKRQENTKEDDELELYNPHYTDAPKYAKKYYGEVYHATTRYDNEWD